MVDGFRVLRVLCRLLSVDRRNEFRAMRMSLVVFSEILDPCELAC